MALLPAYQRSHCCKRMAAHRCSLITWRPQRCVSHRAPQSAVSAQQRYARRCCTCRSALGTEDTIEPAPSTLETGTAANGKPQQFRSSWGAREAGGTLKEGEDYLQQLGQSEVNLNIDTGQNSMMLDSLFTGKFLGHKSDIADGTLRDYESRKYANLVGDYYVSPRFLNAVALHVAKNYLVGTEAFDAQARVPLILGVWGPKGQGKTFQTELAFKKMGLEPIIMSAGELEHEWAGTPGRLIRERYRRAAEISRVRGKLSCLVINDIDAGIGRFANTQCTVNNQMVVGTLMNICDSPTRVSIGAAWRENDIIRRVPIIVTGNDFSTLFAPLIRDGRMEKFYWKPDEEDLAAILFQMYKDDGLSEEDMRTLLRAFDGQPLDFFGAIRARSYDDQILAWIQGQAGHELISDEANLADLCKKLVKKIDLPQFKPLQLTIDMLLREGRSLVAEQDAVNSLKLSAEYMRNTAGGGASLIGLSG